MLRCIAILPKMPICQKIKGFTYCGVLPNYQKSTILVYEVWLMEGLRMAEKDTQTRPVVLSDEEKKFNRQVNYFIMRYMWQVVRGRKRETGDTIYDAFNTSRERYTRIINTGIVRYFKGELGSLQQCTGLRKEIFTGDVRFECPYKIKTKDGVVQKTITIEDWVKLFEWRSNRGSDTGDKAHKKKTCQNEICDRLKLVPRNDMDNWDFYRLCFYLKNMEAAPLKVSADKLREIETTIKELSFSLLDRCEVGQLQKLQKLLKDKQTLISAMVVYKNAKDKEREK